MKVNEGYIYFMRSNKKSENTISTYSKHINQMLNIVNKPERDITTKDLDEWRKEISNLSSATIGNKIEAVKSYFKFLKRIGVVDSNPIEDMEKPHIVNKKKEYMSEEMLDSMIAIAGIREKAILTMFKINGPRVSEMTNLTIDEYNRMKKYNTGYISIIAKGQVHREVYFTKEMIDLIDRYLKTRNDDSDYLFVSNWGGHINGNNLNQTWKILARKAGIPFWKDIGSHYFRMACATIYAEKGMPIEEIRDLLGHSSIAVTNTYLKSSPDKVRNKIMMYN